MEKIQQENSSFLKYKTYLDNDYYKFIKDFIDYTVMKSKTIEKLTQKELAKIMVRFPQVLINVDGVNKANLTTSKAIAAAIGDSESKLGANGRILLRASGTEPLVRVMVEAESEVVAGEIAKTLATLVRLELS